MLEADICLALKQHLELLSASERVESLLGYEIRGLLSSSPPFERAIHAADLAQIRRLFYLTIAPETGLLNVRMRHASGRIVCISWHYERAVTTKGETILSVTLAQPTAEHIASADDGSPLNLMTVFDSVNECVHIKDRNHLVILANHNFRNEQSNSAGELRDVKGLSDYDLFPEEFADESYAAETEVLAGKSVEPLLQERLDGGGRKEWINHRKFPLRDRSGAVIAILTIAAVTTEHVLAERALRASEISLKEAQKIAGVGSFFLDIESQTWAASDVLYEILGLEKGCDHSVAVWNHLIHPDDIGRLSALFGEIHMSPAKILDGEARFIRQTDGNPRWAHLRARFEMDPRGTSSMLRGTIEDITERKAVEAELRESAGLLRLFVEDAPAGLAMFDDKLHYMSASRRWIEDRGLKEWNVTGRSIYEIGSTIPERWKEEHRRALAGEASPFAEDRYEREDGSQRWLRRTVRPWWTGQGKVGGIVVLSEDITERKQAEVALEQSRNLLQLFIEHAPAAIAMFDREMRYLAVSRRWLEDYGLADTEVIGRSHYEVLPEIPERWKAFHRRGLDGESLRMDEDLFKRADGSECWLRWEIEPWKESDGTIAGIILFTEDITDLKLNENRLRLAANVFTHASEGIVIANEDGTILDVNHAFTRITGYTREEVLGQNPRILRSGRQTDDFYAEMWARLKEKGNWSGEIWNRAKDGEIYAEMMTINAVPDPADGSRQYVAIFSDLTPIKEGERLLKHMSHFDVVTGLPNRVLFGDRLRQAMAQSRRQERMTAVAYLDLDDFRAVNDRHGHIVGDQLLVAVTQRMTAALRAGDTLARLGGDEFAVVLPEIENIEESLALIANLRDSVAPPVEIADLTLQLTVSVGVTFFPQSEDVEPDQLLRQADQAMYFAKLSGKGRCHVFDPSLDRSMRGRHEDLNRVRRAMQAQEFELFFQPRVNMRTGEVLGAEALIRWRHPELGLLLPEQFLPIMRGNILSVELGEWVIDNALTHMDSWREGGLDIPVSVNVEALQLQEPRFVERLKELLARHPGIQSSKLELEILESSAFEDVSQASDVIRACSNLGISSALDDFGTGYSSLSYLKRLPVDVLKIDRSFVRDMLEDPEDLTILAGVLVLANTFRRQAVAEGVETVDHGMMLLRLGCPVAQGYGIARPMPGREIPGWVAGWRPDPRWAGVPAVDPVHWPLLYASVEHRAWTAEVEAFLKGDRTAPSTIDPYLCRFGSWLDAEVSAGRGTQPSFEALGAEHCALHSHVNSVLVSGGRNGQKTIEGIKELHQLRDTFLEKLQQYVELL